MTSLDMRYGRQGGRVVPFRQRPTDRRCEVCGGPMVDDTADVHRDCATDRPLEGQATLF